MTGGGEGSRTLLKRSPPFSFYSLKLLCTNGFGDFSLTSSTLDYQL